MSSYRMLQDHYINGQVLTAGTTQATIDVGGLLPVGWVPTPNVDPLDTAAVAAFYAVGPVSSGLVFIKPVTYWTGSVIADFSSPDFSPVDFNTSNIGNAWKLTGLGANQALYPPVNI